jgi:hypothetical protein
VIIVSDASGQLRDYERPARRILGVTKRANAILMGRVRGSQYSDLSDRRRSGALRGLMIVHLKRGLPSPPRDWSGSKERYVRRDDILADVEQPDYGIDRRIQRAIAELRTDLDAFSDDEGFSLMALGYVMSGVELQRLAASLPELASADPHLRESVTWPFAHVVDRLRSGDEALLQALLRGHSRFFRKIHALRQQLRGAASTGAGDASGSQTASRAVRAVGRHALAPTRRILAAPLAVVGGVGTKLYRRLARR